MKLFNIICIILFIISAALQYNDTDPYLWMPIYLYGAVLCYSALKGNYNSNLYMLGLVVYSSYGLYLFFASDGVLSWIKQPDSESIVQSMDSRKPWIEETREFFGLVILIFVLIINRAWFSKKPNEPKERLLQK
ncbi:transmembrane 220 family protein [Gelidibacter gilvus]|uniref:Transmembrane family 220, helix n=1 Tax=Gelidibacter gilvus TaxID=59602 RepID=A0A4Q0XHT9_9FLAO|nr:transmembrane 220 family protein [Gelidibacter gilvus]RXJ49569.1 hypothetical protein ESZ48_11185 [Gelidibacter gilvus]